jgi:hypothetical protein
MQSVSTINAAVPYPPANMNIQTGSADAITPSAASPKEQPDKALIATAPRKSTVDEKRSRIQNTRRWNFLKHAPNCDGSGYQS